MTAHEPGIHERPLAGLALRAARAGAAAIAGVVARGEVRPDVKTGAHDLVTAADRASEAAIIEVIRAERPDDAILGEESGAHPGNSGTRWLVDPLDGSANFVYGRADYAVSVGVESAGAIVAGAIIRPSDGRWMLADVIASEIAVGAELAAAGDRGVDCGCTAVLFSCGISSRAHQGKLFLCGPVGLQHRDQRLHQRRGKRQHDAAPRRLRMRHRLQPKDEENRS